TADETIRVCLRLVAVVNLLTRVLLQVRKLLWVQRRAAPGQKVDLLGHQLVVHHPVHEAAAPVQKTGAEAKHDHQHYLQRDVPLPQWFGPAPSPSSVQVRAPGPALRFRCRSPLQASAPMHRVTPPARLPASATRRASARVLVLLDPGSTVPRTGHP